MSARDALETPECLYGFQRKFFLDVLQRMAESLYPNDSEEMIWEYRVPEVLDRLYETMDQGDRTFCDELFTIENLIIKQKDNLSTKSLDLLTKALKEQKDMHDRKRQMENGKPEGKTSRKPRIPVAKIKTIAKKPNENQNVKRKSNESHSELPKPAKISRNTQISAIPVDFGSLRLEALDGYDIPREIFRIENNQDNSYASTIEYMVQNSTSNRFDYIQAYTALLHLEEAAEIVSLKKYNQIIQLAHRSGKTFQIRNDKNVRKIQQGIDESLLDRFELKLLNGTIVASGQISGSNKEFIFVDVKNDMDSTWLKRICGEKSLEIDFKINDLTFKIQHMALEYTEKYDLHSLLIANPKYNLTGDGNHSTLDSTNYNFCGQLAKDLNAEQKLVVMSIANMRKPPNSLPYLLFGPAGTGKTKTLVATIEEIVRSSEDFILVCANSNSACDEIAQRLLSILDENEMFRMYAISWKEANVDNDIKKRSNFVEGRFKFPCLQFLYKYRVVICTLIVAGHLMRARNDPHFDPKHFSHLIIDECASTNEITSLIPIAGLCCTESGIQAKIILAGDPKQLDAVCRSTTAADLGFKTSLMERLFNQRIYMRNPDTGKYNPEYITQLVKNYRSHAAILYVANELFYDRALKAYAPEEITDWFIDSHILKNKKVPIMFKAVYGCTKQLENDSSLYNMEEVEAVINQIIELTRSEVNNRKIKASDIGVVTPYRLQCRIISRICRQRGFSDIAIGTAEVFQGQEKAVIILSTVRTGGTLGFVNSTQRINVILTRAKSLLVVIGDPETLYKDDNWRYLLEFCSINKSFIDSESKKFIFIHPIKEIDYQA